MLVDSGRTDRTPSGGGQSSPDDISRPAAGPAQRRVDRALTIVLAVIVLATLALALMSLAWPFGPDQAVLTMVARIWLEGGAPFRDAIDHKGPYAYLPFMLAEWVGGGSMIAIRTLDLAVIAAALASCMSSLRRLYGSRTATWTVAILGAWCFRISYGDLAQPDEWIALATAVTFFRRMEAPDATRGHTVIAIGLLTGVAILVKPFYGALGGFPLLTMLAARRVRPAELLACGARVAAWAALPITLMLGWLSISGALDATREIYLGPLLSAYRGGDAGNPLSHAAQGLASFFRKSWMVPLVPCMAIGVWTLLGRNRRDAVLVLAWFAVGLTTVVVQGKYFAYHFFPVMAPAALLAALAIASLRGRMLARGTLGGQWAAAGTLALVVAFSLAVASRPVRDLGVIVPDVASGTDAVEAIRRAQPRAGLTAGYAAAADVAALLDSVGQSGRELGVFLFDPTPLLLARARPSTRAFVISTAYTHRDRFGDSVLTGLADEIARERPAYVLVDCWLSWDTQGGTDPSLSDSLNRVLRDGYALVSQVEGVQVRRRRSAWQPARDDDTSLCPRR